MKVVQKCFHIALARYGNPETAQFRQGTEGKLLKAPVLLFYVGPEYPYYRVDFSFVGTAIFN
jgi:hypothetical protein